ncbi:MAG: glutathione S-transferase [Polyangiaceae bacterium]|nr:glutathione S-transferase [Myxococcales bacterium]MCB9588735.1 glutathione S-transferase [Polyangiaceae bacterium]MCB9605293.1 glutathione S-transferase [Polyangiaceae bacterium]
MTQSTNAILLYGFPLSGHAHRARLMLNLLGLAFEETLVDLAKGEQKHPEFLEVNVFGKVPVIVDDGTVIADSNAILVYLALRYDPERSWLPKDPVVQAEIQRWLSIAAGPLAYGPAAARVSEVFGAPRDEAHPAIAKDLFTAMERHLAGRDWLVAATPTIADLALYTYCAHAPEGRISLDPYPRLRGWVARVEALPRFVPMQRAA